MRGGCFTRSQRSLKRHLAPIEGDVEVIMNCGGWEVKVRLRAPDPCRCFHHQEDVNSVTKSPPERSAEKQLDPHL